ncbi:MAG: peptidase S41 [Chitinophagaceae bacterium]|nr:peptidase S41 [Chitinophagaceae bacterium]
MRLTLALWIVMVIFQSCVAGKAGFEPDRKFSLQELNRDYNIFQSVLEESHPGLYWYTPKDSMDHYFKWGRQQIKDSLKGYEFRQVLNYVIARVNCGHTSLLSAGGRSKDSAQLRIFPLSLKLWPGTMVVVSNLNRHDSILKRGTVITSVNGKNFYELTDTLNRYLSSDGYNLTNKLQSLSSRSGFGSVYRTVYGIDHNIQISFTDSLGTEKDTVIRSFIPVRDTSRKADKKRIQREKTSRKERRNMIRNITFDNENNTAIMHLHSFGRNYGIHKFIKKSFRSIRKNGSKNLVIDLRSNGGGSVTNSTLLTKYISNAPFKVADSLYAINRKSNYSALIDDYFFNHLFMVFMTKKKNDGKYHFGYFEKHYFKPRKKNHFGGNVYVLTGGNSFSASTLFAQVINHQPNVYFVGEETGGGAYGNTAWLIPEVKLPATHIKFRLPLFRLVIDKNVAKDGRGIQPDVEAFPSVDAIRQGRDYKMEKALQLIKENTDSRN